MRTPSPSSREAVAIPDAVQLVRSYQGSIDGPNGTRQWLRLQITGAQPAATGIEFQYTLNVPDHREDKKGVLEPGGVIRFESFTGHTRVEKNMVIVESEGIDGPPYFHLVGRPPSP